VSFEFQILNVCISGRCINKHKPLLPRSNGLLLAKVSSVSQYRAGWSNVPIVARIRII